MGSLSKNIGLIFMEEDHMHSIKLFYFIMFGGAASAVCILLACAFLAYVSGWFKVLFSIFSNIIGPIFWNSVETISRKFHKI